MTRGAQLSGQLSLYLMTLIIYEVNLLGDGKWMLVSQRLQKWLSFSCSWLLMVKFSLRDMWQVNIQICQVFFNKTHMALHCGEKFGQETKLLIFWVPYVIMENFVVNHTKNLVFSDKILVHFSKIYYLVPRI